MSKKYVRSPLGLHCETAKDSRQPITPKFLEEDYDYEITIADFCILKKRNEPSLQLPVTFYHKSAFTVGLDFSYFQQIRELNKIWKCLKFSIRKNVYRHYRDGCELSRLSLTYYLVMFQHLKILLKYYFMTDEHNIQICNIANITRIFQEVCYQGLISIEQMNYLINLL